MKDDKPKDLVELHRMKYPTADMMTHPPIPVADFAHHVMSMKADDAEKIVQEFEVCVLCRVISEFVVEIILWQTGRDASVRSQQMPFHF